MNSVFVKMLVWAIKGLIGNVDWVKVFTAVELYFGGTISGEEKRVLVINILKEEGLKAETFLRNLAIEIALTKLKSL